MKKKIFIMSNEKKIKKFDAEKIELGYCPSVS